MGKRACVECGQPPAPGHTRCLLHLERHRTLSRRRRDRARAERFAEGDQQRLIDLVAAGTPITAACTEVGVAVSRVHALRHLDVRWAQRLDAALLKGRDPGLPHGTGLAYKKGCRCPECRRAKYLERGLRARPQSAPAAPPAVATREPSMSPARPPRRRLADPAAVEAAVSSRPDRGGRSGRRGRLTDAERAVIRTEWMANTATVVIAHALNLDKTTVNRAVVRMNLPPRDTTQQGRRPPRRLDQSDVEELKRLRLTGKTIGETAEELGVHRTTVIRQARALGISRSTVRTAVADLMCDRTGIEEGSPAPELPVTLDMPGKVVDFLRTVGLEPAERAALDQGVTVRRGHGYTLRVSTTPAVHRRLLARCQPLDGTQGISTIQAQRKARREYELRVTTLTPTGP